MDGSTAEQASAGQGRKARAAFKRSLNRVYGAYALAFLLFVLALAVAERMGLGRAAIGIIFLLSTVGLYACIGLVCRTSEPSEYYVAGRRVPAVYNGMATAADWMSAASFISVAGTLYLSGYGGLAYVMGWTGGYCLVALLLAPYLRKFGQYTIPDFLGARYGGNVVRLVGVVAAILCSFTYLVAQIYGVGLITARLSGLAFEVGIFVGLGGILVCSFLGGMRAVTWTQVAQYIVLAVAYLIPVVWLSVKQMGAPVPQAVYGQQLQKVTEREAQLIDDPKEKEVIAVYRARADELQAKLQDVPASLSAERALAKKRVEDLERGNAPLQDLQAAKRALALVPKDEKSARLAWTKAKEQADLAARPLGGMPRHGTPYAGDPQGDEPARKAFGESRLNFLALVFCLMVGTAGLPHILTRSYTTPSVREARSAVAWSMFFILLVYLTAPALAVLVKFEILNVVVGMPFDRLPAWILAWAKVDPSLLSVSDVNRDGILQLGEIKIGGDIIVLATPEIGGLPYVISGLVAAGALAAALSTADGLLLTIANALSHDTYYKVIDPQASRLRRVMISKLLLLVVALMAALLAVNKPADILFLVSAAFSFAASAFFPALVLGIFWKRANQWGAVAGMVAGLGMTLYYMVMTEPWLRGVFGVNSPVELWFGILPISAGLFGVPVGFAVVVVVSLLTRPPGEGTNQLVNRLRSP